MIKFLLTTAVIMAIASPGLAAGTIERACLASKRQAKTRTLCNCIQQTANVTLTATDQRTAAGFFKDPEKAQKIKRSDRSTHEAFWDRYIRFGATARKNCSR